MKILGFIVSRQQKENKKEMNPPTLVVTGQCSDTELEKFESHCQKKGQCVIATKLPVLGVFNMQNPSVIPREDGTK